jgi:ATP-dependent helicase/nuclease subunit B
MMGLRLIAGPPGSGKTHKIIHEIQDLNRADPLGPPIILIVPEQATFQTERLVLSAAPHGVMRVQVLSFARLGRWIQARRPKSGRPILSDVHREVILTSVLARMKRAGEEGSLLSVPHLESAVTSLLGELKQGNVRATDLAEWAGQIREKNPTLANKLSQLAEVVREFDKAVHDRFEDPQDTMLSLAQSVRGFKDLQGAHVYVDAFYGYTAVEREVLRGLLSAFPQVTITLVLDEPIGAVLDKEALTRKASGRCAPSVETLQQLMRLAERECPGAIEFVDLAGDNDAESRFDAPELKFLADKFMAGIHRRNWLEPTDRIRLVQALDLREQASAAVLQIERWHREKDWRWGEMAIIARNVDEVAQEIGEALLTLRIPHFLDRNQPQQTHPIIQGTLTALEVVLRGWRQESILAFAKSGLFPFNPDAVAKLEWFCQKYPRRDSEWRQHNAWEKPPERSPFEPGEGRRAPLHAMEEYDELRRRIMEPLFAVERRLADARSKTGTLPAMNVVEAICQLVHEGTRHRAVSGSDEYTQQVTEDPSVLTQFGRLMEAIAIAAGDEHFEPAVLLDMFASLLGDFRLQRIPPKIDQLLVAQADRSRLPELRGVVVIGLAEGEFPAPGANRTLLSDQERETLADFATRGEIEKEVRSSARKLFKREAFFAWWAMSRASQAITLIRPTVSRQGEKLNPSPWWSEVSRLFPKLQEENAGSIPIQERTLRAREAASIIGAHWGGLREYNPPLPPGQLQQYADAFLNPRDKAEFDRVIRSASRRNEASLSHEMTRQLLGGAWSASATALEAFASCPFKFFMRTIMRPDIKQETQANPMDLGNLAHAVLKEVFDRVRTEPIDLATMADEELKQLVSECQKKPLERLQAAGLLRSRLGEIQAELLEEQVHGIVRHFRDLAALVGLRNLHTEVSFSRHPQALNAPAITVTLQDGTTTEVVLTGQIDRIDVWGEHWLFLLDYKLGARQIQWTEVADGKSLQLPVYLMVLRENADSLVPSGGKVGGAFYVAITARANAGMRMRGAISTDAALDIFPEGTAGFYISMGGATTIKQGSKGDIVDDGNVLIIMEGARHLISRHLQEIFGGTATVNPARIGTTIACRGCDYRTSCRLDYTMNRARLVQKRNKDEALAHLSALQGGIEQ